MLATSTLGVFGDWWMEITALLVTGLLTIYVFFQYKFSYWKRLGVPYSSGTVPFGAYRNFVLGKQPMQSIIQDIYSEAKGQKYVGFYSFWTPNLLVRDTELIKRILIKDFDYFAARGVYYNDKDDPLSANLFTLDGPVWRTTREKLAPTFTSGKMRQMYEVMKNCALQLQEYMDETIAKDDVIDFKHLIARSSLNVIANAAVGIETHSLKNESQLSEIAFKATDPSIVQSFRFGLSIMSKPIAKIFRIRFTPKIVEKYYLDITKHIVEYRSKNNIIRNDAMQYLMAMWDKSYSLHKRDDADINDGLSLRDIAAHTFIYILGGYETTASLTSFTLYELAKNPDIQEKLRKEVLAAGSLDDITYEKIHELKYTDMVVNESLRKHPPAGIVMRECVSDYKLPDGQTLEKGVFLSISTRGLGRDPELYPDPDKFDPERFNKENPSHFVHPFSFVPFGDGPRFCIGKRFGLLQTKVTLFALVSKFRFEITQKTADPPELDPKIFLAQSKGGMYLKVIPINSATS